LYGIGFTPNSSEMEGEPGDTLTFNFKILNKWSEAVDFEITKKDWYRGTIGNRPEGWTFTEGTGTLDAFEETTTSSSDSTKVGISSSADVGDTVTIIVLAKVTSDDGNEGAIELELEVTVMDDTAPMASFSWSYTNDTGGIVTGASMEGRPTHFDASSSSDNSGGPLTYFWDFGDGSNGDDVTVEHIFNDIPENGFNVALTVTDSSGNQDVVTYNIKPAQKERPDLYLSTIYFSNDNPEGGDVVTITTVVKLIGRVNVTETFVVGFYLGDTTNQIGSVSVDGNQISLGIEKYFNVSTTWEAVSGIHSVYVIVDSTNVVDESDEKNVLSYTITVVPGVPTAIAGQDIRINPGGTVQFSGAGTDEDGSITKYEWDFDGDGIYEWSSNENGLTTFIYNNAGTHIATLRVTDNDGNIATDSLTVTVKSAGEEESRLPSLSLLLVTTMFGLVAIFRRK
jgi:hypothetical protein